MIFYKLTDNSPIVLAFLCLMSAACSTISNSDNTYSHIVGFLENPTTGKGRLAFCKANGQWYAVCVQNKPSIGCLDVSIPKVPFIVLANGKQIKTLKGIKATADYQTTNFITTLSPPKKGMMHFPVGNISGWNGKLKYRPLLIASPGKSIFVSWNDAITVNAELLRRVKKQLMDMIGSIESCDSKENTVSQRSVTPNDIELFRSIEIENTLLLGVRLKNGLYSCDGPLPEQWSTNWFIVSRGNISFLDWKRNSTLLRKSKESSVALYFLDAADLDGDGSIELLFFVSGYNMDGYALTEINNQKLIISSWSYH